MPACPTRLPALLLGTGLALALHTAAGAKVLPPTDLGLLNNGAYASARVVTPGGEVVGFAPSTKAPYLDTAVLWRRGKAVNLGRHPGGTVSRAYGINDKGQVVGEGNLVPNGPMHALRWTLKAGQATAVEVLGPRQPRIRPHAARSSTG